MKKEKAVKKVERLDEDIESRYEERAERNAAKDDGGEAMAVDEVEDVDALPVKSLTGELRYLSAPKKSSGSSRGIGFEFVHRIYTHVFNFVEYGKCIKV